MAVKNFFKMLGTIKRPAVITTMGQMGSGKTTLAHLAYYYFKRQGLAFYEIENKKDIRNISDNSFVLLDDFSFKVEPRRKEDREWLTQIFRLRHWAGNNVILWFNVHYVKAIAPFLRSTPYRILTSLTTQEIRLYENEYLFHVADLWDYLRALYRYPDRRLILASFGIYTEIIDVTLSPAQLRKILNSVKNPTRS